MELCLEREAREGIGKEQFLFAERKKISSS
jgi:hypothetical protein